jgi:hypothetical protein
MLLAQPSGALVLRELDDVSAAWIESLVLHVKNDHDHQPPRPRPDAISGRRSVARRAAD